MIQLRFGIQSMFLAVICLMCLLVPLPNSAQGVPPPQKPLSDAAWKKKVRLWQAWIHHSAEQNRSHYELNAPVPYLTRPIIIQGWTRHLLSANATDPERQAALWATADWANTRQLPHLHQSRNQMIRSVIGRALMTGQPVTFRRVVRIYEDLERLHNHNSSLTWRISYVSIPFQILEDVYKRMIGQALLMGTVDKREAAFKLVRAFSARMQPEVLRHHQRLNPQGLHLAQVNLNLLKQAIKLWPIQEVEILALGLGYRNPKEEVEKTALEMVRSQFAVCLLTPPPHDDPSCQTAGYLTRKFDFEPSVFTVQTQGPLRLETALGANTTTSPPITIRVRQRTH